MRPSILLMWALSATTAYAQVDQLWMDFNVQKKLSDRVTVTGDLGPRFQSDWGLTTAFLRMNANLRFCKIFTATGGLSCFHYRNPPATEIHEFRPVQGIRADLLLGTHVNFQHFVRVEERFLRINDNDDFVLRLRYQPALIVLLCRNTEKDRSIYLPVQFEIFSDVNKGTFVNRHRAYFGIGCSLKKARMEGFYIAQSSRKGRSDDFELNENIYRLRVFSTL